MPLKNYGVLVGRAVGTVREGAKDTPHYQIHVRTPDGNNFRIAVNVLSNVWPSELLFIADDDFQHPITDIVRKLEPGWHDLKNRPNAGALDFIRGNLFDPAEMRPLPPDAEGDDNDLADRLDHYVHRAISDPEALVYAFGERWGPEPNTKDKVFKFLPGNGVHDIHMNQGNVSQFTKDDGVWQDGGLLIHLPSVDRWIGIFLAFQSQSWHTDDITGHSLEGPERTDWPVVRVLAAMVNPFGPAPEDETVLLLNASPHDIDLTGWKLTDKAKKQFPLPAKTLLAGDTLLMHLASPVALGNKGGQITVLDAQGLKVHGVSYTAAEGGREGWTVTF